MASLTFRDLLHHVEEDDVDANLKPEDKVVLKAFLPAFSTKIQEVCGRTMDIRKGRSKEVTIVGGDFPQFNITPHFIAAACLMQMKDPEFVGVRLRYFERTTSVTAENTTTYGMISGVKVKWG